MVKQAHQLTQDTLTGLQTGRLAYVAYKAATLRVIGDSFVMDGRGGKHSLLIAATDLERLNKHWLNFAAEDAETVKRQKTERDIAEAFIKQALAAGRAISVWDGGDTVLSRSKSCGEILAAMFSTDEDVLTVWKADDTNPAAAMRREGSVHFIYGNDGYDVIADHSISLQPLLTDADAVSAQAEEARA